jgi:hypothetical protein
MLRVLRYSPKPVANITHKRQISEAVPRDERPNAPNDAPNEAPWLRLNSRNERRGDALEESVDTRKSGRAHIQKLTRNIFEGFHE